MLIDLYIILFLLGLGLLVTAAKFKHIIPSIFATVLFLTLAFESLNIEMVTSAGETLIYQEATILYVNYLLALISFLITMVGMVSVIRGRNKPVAIGV